MNKRERMASASDELLRLLQTVGHAERKEKPAPKMPATSEADLIPLDDELGNEIERLVAKYGEDKVDIWFRSHLHRKRGKQRSQMNKRVNALIVKAAALGYPVKQIADCIVAGSDFGVDKDGNQVINYWIPREGDPFKTAFNRVRDVIWEAKLAEPRRAIPLRKEKLSPSQLIFTPLAENVPKLAHRVSKSKSVSRP